MQAWDSREESATHKDTSKGPLPRTGILQQKVIHLLPGTSGRGRILMTRVTMSNCSRITGVSYLPPPNEVMLGSPRILLPSTGSNIICFYYAVLSHDTVVPALGDPRRERPLALYGHVRGRSQLSTFTY